MRGYIRGGKKPRRVTKIFTSGKASIACGIPPAAENGRPRATLWFAGKRLASKRQPIHLGRAVPADYSTFPHQKERSHFCKNLKLQESIFKKKPTNGCVTGNIEGVRREFQQIYS